MNTPVYIPLICSITLLFIQLSGLINVGWDNCFGLLIGAILFAVLVEAKK